MYINFSSFDQVLRYSALAAGVVYGLYHQSSLNSSAKTARIDQEYSRKESLIKQAKEEWQKKNSPPQPKAEGGMWFFFFFPTPSSGADLILVLLNSSFELGKRILEALGRDIC